VAAGTSTERSLFVDAFTCIWTLCTNVDGGRCMLPVCRWCWSTCERWCWSTGELWCWVASETMLITGPCEIVKFVVVKVCCRVEICVLGQIHHLQWQ
jgi:hypothetical protein